MSEYNIKTNKKQLDDIQLWKPLRTIKSDYFKKYITGSDIKNFLLNDPILDWLNIYYTKKTIVSNGEHNPTHDSFLLFKNGIEFEKQIFDRLKSIYNEKFIMIACSGKNDFNEVNYRKTVEEIKKGTPIIAQGVLFNDINGTGGIADLIVRSDYINKLTKNPALYTDECNIKAENLDGNYHYRIIDIKWSTFTLCTDNCSLRNEGFVTAYKGQIAIYNVALGEIQGYFPSCAYILAKHWRIDNDTPVILNWNDLLGIINYKNFDYKYIEKTKNAICWLNKLKNNGSAWDLYNPVVQEMYPNMANKNDMPWSEIKLSISEKINELTQIWYVGVQNRIFAHEKNVFKWSDPNCTSEILNIKGSSRPATIDKILSINRSETELISPKKITNNIFNWMTKQSCDFYVDFETITSALFSDVDIDDTDNKISEVIFMIGVGYIYNTNWVYKVFTCENLTLESENKIITNFFEYINEIYNSIKNESDSIRIFHWHNAEVSNMERAESRHNNKWIEYEKSIIWVDMCKIFMEEPIVVKGAFNFKLKDITNAINKLGLINIKWPSDGPTNGFDAMCQAVKYYKEIIINTEIPRTILNSIEEYNHIDCISVWEIVNYLRKHNC